MPQRGKRHITTGSLENYFPKFAPVLEQRMTGPSHTPCFWRNISDLVGSWPFVQCSVTRADPQGGIKLPLRLRGITLWL